MSLASVEKLVDIPKKCQYFEKLKHFSIDSEFQFIIKIFQSQFIVVIMGILWTLELQSADDKRKKSEKTT